jgi:signal transduction histidine kinase
VEKNETKQPEANYYASSNMVYKMSPDWKEMYILNGKNILSDTGDRIDDWTGKYIPKEDRPLVWQTAQRAIDSKNIFELEHRFYRENGSVGWMLTRAVPVIDQDGKITEWLGTGSDISKRKNAEAALHNFNVKLEYEVRQRTAELRQSRDLLRSVFDTSWMQLSILEAIRDESGKIIDLSIKLANSELEKLTGRRDLVGKRYGEEYPGIYEIGVFEAIVKTIETGRPQQLEYYYEHEGFKNWFSSMFVKLNDGVVSGNMDITDRKKAEEERFKNYLLLQQSEEIALLGSWDYNLLTKTFTWSSGMYRLFDLERDRAVTPEIYLEYTTDKGRPAAERIVEHLRTGDTDFEETLELIISGKVKMMRIKAMVVTDNNNHPVRVLGVDKDVTAAYIAEERIRNMQAEQQLEIVRVSLTTLEEERYRISESLHNGIGQLLYGVKISLNNLRQNIDHGQFLEAKAFTNKLLSDAIVETRRISHELMPTTLEEFGLKSAIDDICQQLSDEVKFKYTVSGLHMRLEKYLELAVYRTVQELMINVVKHANATTAEVNVTISAKDVKIVVNDNGRGMEADDGKQKSGIGLASIRSKISLLNGKMKIDSDAKKGTTVRIVIPIFAKNI